jgi:SET domain-containing protein
MLTIKTKIKKSKIAGIGLFASQNIKKGTIVWKWSPITDFKITKGQFKSLPRVTQKAIMNYCYGNKKGEYVMCGDDARFFNHSNSPNCSEGNDVKPTTAIRDIKMGEELTVDYYEFDRNYKNGKKQIPVAQK